MATPEELLALFEELEAPSQPKSVVPEEDLVPDEKSMLTRFFDYVSGAPEAEGLMERGFSTEGAPLSVRAMSSLPTDPVSKAREAIKILDKDGQTEFKLDKETRRLGYKRPGDDQFTIIDPPGMDFGDWAELFGDAPALAGETIGYLLSKRVPGGGPIKKALKSGLGLFTGAAAGESAREAINIESGAYEHLTPEQIERKQIAEPLEAGGLAVAGAGVVRTGAEAFNLVKNFMLDLKIPGRFIDKGLEIQDKLPTIISEINESLAKAGKTERFNPNSAQVLNDPEFYTALDHYMRTSSSEGQQLVKELYEGNVDALKAYADDALGSVENISGYEGGRAVSEALESQRGLAETAMESRVASATGDAQIKINQIDELTGREGSSASSGEYLRGVPEQELDTVSKLGDKLYSPIAQEADKLKFYQTGLLTNAKKQLADIEKVPGSNFLAGENKGLLENIIDDLEVMRSTPSGGEYKGVKTLAHDPEQRLISNLKRLERNIDKGHLPNMEKNSVTELRLAAISDRTARYAAHDAKHGTDLVKQQQGADKIYAQAKDKLRGTMAKLLSSTDGRPKIKDEAVFRTIFGPDKTTATSAREFSTLLDGPDFVDEYDALREMIMDQFLKDNTKDRVLNPDKALKWIQDRKQVLTEYLPAEARMLLNDAATSQEGVIALLGRQKAWQKAIKGSVGAEFVGKRPSQVFKRAWSTPESLTALKKATEKQFPEQWSLFKRAAQDKMRRSFEEYDQLLEKKTLSFPRLNKALDDPDTVEKLDILFGPQYVQDLGKLRDAAAILQRKPTKVHMEEENLYIDLLKKLTLKPLSPWGRKIRGAQSFFRRKSYDNLMEVVLDPALLNSVSKRNRFSDSAKNIQNIFGAGVATELSSDDPLEVFKEDSGVTTLIRSIRGNDALRSKIRSALED